MKSEFYREMHESYEANRQASLPGYLRLLVNIQENQDAGELRVILADYENEAVRPNQATVNQLIQDGFSVIPFGSRIKGRLNVTALDGAEGFTVEWKQP